MRRTRAYTASSKRPGLADRSRGPRDGTERELVECRVQPPLLHEVLVRPVFPQPAPVQDEDAISSLDSGESVGDDQARATREEPIQRVLQDALGLGIDAGRRLVEHQNGGIIYQG